MKINKTRHNRAMTLNGPTKIGLTGATGHLGQELSRYSRARGLDVLPLHRGEEIPRDIDVLFHVAAPRGLDAGASEDFMTYNKQILEAKKKRAFRVIGAGSLWQLGQGVSKSLPYTRLKDWQQHFLNDTTLVLYSVYSEKKRIGRGFIPELIESVRSKKFIKHASSEPRDWIHIDDVCSSFLCALGVQDGTYQVCTGLGTSPATLVKRFLGYNPLELNQPVPYTLRYENPYLPNWSANIEVNQWISTQIRKASPPN